MKRFIDWLKRNEKIVAQGNIGVSNRNQLVLDNCESFLWDKPANCKACVLLVLMYKETAWE